MPAVEPPVQLPAHPVGGGILGQRLGASPDTFQLLTVGGLGVDGQPGTSDPGGEQAAVQHAGQGPARERGRVHPVDRGVAVHPRVEFVLGVPPRRRPARLATGDAVSGDRVGAEPRRHIAARQLGELSDRADAHPPQQVCQVLPVGGSQAGLGGQLPDGQSGQEHRVLTRFDDPAGTGREDRRRQLVGDPDLAFGSGGGHGVDQFLGGGPLGPEVTGGPAHRQNRQSRPQHLGTRDQLVDRGRDAFEMAGVAGGIGGDDMQLGTARLRFAAPQTSPDADRPRRRRARDNPVGQCDRDRHGRRHADRGGGGDGRPVHAPERQDPGTHLIRRPPGPDARSDHERAWPAAPG